MAGLWIYCSGRVQWKIKCGSKLEQVSAGQPFEYRTHSLSLFGNDSDVRHLDIGHIRLATSTTRRHLIKKKANDQVCVWGYTGVIQKVKRENAEWKGHFLRFQGESFYKTGRKASFFRLFFLWNNEDTPCGCLKYFFATLLDTGFTGCDFVEEQTQTRICDLNRSLAEGEGVGARGGAQGQMSRMFRTRRHRR